MGRSRFFSLEIVSIVMDGTEEDKRYKTCFFLIIESLNVSQNSLKGREQMCVNVFVHLVLETLPSVI